MINPSIARLVLGKLEREAAALLNKFNCKWRVMHRDGVNIDNLAADRDDNRYNLVIRDGKIERVLPG